MAYAAGTMTGAAKKRTVLAVQNIKGGVGKTTIAVNLAALLAEKHHKQVLVIDADPQCNASLYLLDDPRFDARTRNDPQRQEGNLYDLFHGDVRYLDVVTGQHYGPKRSTSNCRELVRTCAGGGSLSLVCGSAELFDVQEIAAELVLPRLKRWIRTTGDAYDHVIIDCPPSISSLSLSALKAADSILVPMAADVFSVHGLRILLETLARYKKVYDIQAKVAGVVLSLFPPDGDARRTGAENYAQRIREACATNVPAIPCLMQSISRDNAYPESFENRLPLPFSRPAHDRLVGELDAIATELGLIGGGP